MFSATSWAFTSGLLHLNDVQVNILAVLFGQLRLQLFLFSAALADYHARLRAVNGDAHTGLARLAVERALNLNFGNAGIVKLLFQLLAQLVIFHEGIAEIALRGEPAAVPIFDDTHAKTVGIDFLTHTAYLLTLSL